MIDGRKFLSTNYTFEVEVTNYCNAKCVFCANKKIHRTRGFLKLSDFEFFVEQIVELKKSSIFHKYNSNQYPRITFCGLGEPLLHPQIDRIVKIAHDAGIYTQLVTNGVLLTAEKLQSLVDSGLDELSISFHSINHDNYYAITGLEISELKSALLDCKSIFESGPLKLALWRIKHPDASINDTERDEIEFQKFIEKAGMKNSVVLGPSEPWSRDGYVPTSKCEKVQDTPFWCNKIVFTVNIDWQGNYVICCNDYNCEHLKLGNAFDTNHLFSEYMKKKMDVFFKKELPDICKNCRRWPDNEIWDIFQNEHIDQEYFLNELNTELDKYN